MGFFDRLYYGKAGKRDYTEMDMPKTRTSLFFLVLKDRFFDLVKLNFLQLIFWLPFLIWTMVNLVVVQSIDAAAILSAENGSATLLNTLSSYMVVWLIGLIPCLLITGPSSAGAAYVMRNWSRDQHAFLFSDFKDAFKSNWKQAIGVSLITSVVPLLAYISMIYYGQMANGNMLMYVPMILVLSMAFVWTLMLPLLYPMLIGYELRFKDVCKNAALMAVASLPKMVASRLITLIPIILIGVGVYIGNGIIVIAVSLYYLLIGFAFSKLVYASFANGVFDRFLNPHIEGADVALGLRPQDADEDDEDDEDEDEDDEE